MKRNWLRNLLVITGLLLLMALWFLLSGGTEDYSEKYASADLSKNIVGIGRENTYTRYLAAHASASPAAARADIDLFTYASEGEVYETQATGAPRALYMGEDARVTWWVDVPETGLYNIRLTYLTVPSRGVDAERAVYINGDVPFVGADTMVFTRQWTDGGEVRTDNQGNVIRPAQIEVFDWQTVFFRDALGYVVEPYRFYFEAGENEVTFESVNEPMLLSALSLTPIRDTVDYAAYIASAPAVQMTDEGKNYKQIIQGEDALIRSSPSLYARYDRSSPDTEPYSLKTTVMNFIGGNAWNYPGQWIEWEIDVPEDGFYTITIKGRQNYQRGGLSCRSLYIDGEIPFSEMDSVTFLYQNSWNMRTLSDENGAPYRFYLKKGTHKLRLEATLDEMGEILRSMEESIYNLNQIYRKLLVLTGVKPDKYRDYKLGEVYPDVIDAMSLESKRLFRLVDMAVATTGQKSDRVAVAQTMATQLESFAEDPDRITLAFVNFKDNITAMGTAMQNMSETKLDIDYIVISGENAALPVVHDGFIRKTLHELKSCFTSYTVDYDMLGDVYDGRDAEQALNVWIVTARDQSTVLKTMIDDDFTPNSGIKVNLKLVDPNALLAAVVAGNGPDVVVSIDSWHPVNYALRNAAEDLTQFSDFEDVIGQFYPSAYSALSWDGGVYGLPETQVFQLLFYREDVLSEYGLTVPDTWEELRAMLPTIQGHNMSVGIIYPTTALPNNATLYSMMYQNGGGIYNKNNTATVIDSEPGVKAFEDFTAFFTDYGLPKEYDFVSRFRSGEMLLGVVDYTTYNTLTVSAPEIRGLWDFALIPGTRQTNENGETYIDRSVHSQGICCMMISTDDETVKQNGWEFMKWWVGADSQVRFGREIESVMGASARYATANIAALSQLAWSDDQLEVLKKQMESAVGFPEIAGGYYTGRNVTNAIRKVVNKKVDPRETLLDYARMVNEEIEKKRSEFGLPLQ